MGGGLRAKAFRGDADVDELHAFFQPERQFDGDTRWTFGTSLKSMYVNTFEFMNHAPVVQLWRDEAGVLQAVSRLSLGTAEWFHQSAPEYRQSDITAALVQQADAALALLTDHESWHTVRYESDSAEIELLQSMGYRQQERAEVYMELLLDQPIDPPTIGGDVELTLLDAADAKQVHERAMAQIDAFSDVEPNEHEQAWITRSLPHQMRYGQPQTQPHVIAHDADGRVLAFADVFCDRTNHIGEFEPVGTRTSAQRSGLGKAVLARGLQEMVACGMTQALVRTGVDNRAAIAAYESVGFRITDHLVRFRHER